jgi:Domain of unknown function (DUF5060)/Protein of unknown function (DUF4038)
MRMRRKRLELNSFILAFLVFLIAYLDVAACTKSGSSPASTESGKHDEQVTALPSAASIECYDFFEMTLRVDKPAARNPFRDVKVSGHFGLIAKGAMLAVDGFCDDPDGTVFRIRFMPAAYSNVTWDLGDDLDRFRSEVWTHETGTMLYGLDPYHHLATSHPVDNRYQDRTSQWFTMTSFQRWKRPLHGWMLDQREQQLRAKRIIPQVNEEYGYEDHYPSFAPYKPPAASAEANRRAAWEIAMAGCYQTTGETAKRGTGFFPNTGAAG